MKGNRLMVFDSYFLRPCYIIILFVCLIIATMPVYLQRKTAFGCRDSRDLVAENNRIIIEAFLSMNCTRLMSMPQSLC